MTIHSLKIESQYLENLKSGNKRAEIRFNDRDYQVGDQLKFYDANYDSYIYFKILHIHSGLGMATGYVVLSVERFIP